MQGQFYVKRSSESLDFLLWFKPTGTSGCVLESNANSGNVTWVFSTLSNVFNN